MRLFPLAPALAILSLCLVLRAEEPTAGVTQVPAQAYKSGDALSDYEKERCQLDLFLPAGKTGFPTLVWLHGGGMTGGSKDAGMTPKLGVRFAKAGIGFAAVNYRLSPKATFPAYVDDAAAAFAWVHAHIAEHGGDGQKVFLGGHSAGAYLSSLVTMDPHYLQALGLNQSALAGVIPISGQMLTHFTVRKEKGLEAETITADAAAPIYFTRKETPPIFIMMGDHDWPARWEENLYFAAAMKAAATRW